MQKYQLEKKDRLLCVSFPDQDILGIKFGDRRKEKLTILSDTITINAGTYVNTIVEFGLAISLSVIINSKGSNG